MGLVENYSPLGFAPCGNRFPAACFRFKKMTFQKVLANRTNPCTQNMDLYHKVGCVWGSSYLSTEAPRKYQTVCQPFLPDYPEQEPEATLHAACFDGFLSAKMSKPAATEQIAKNMCNQWRQYPKSFQVCDYHARTNLLDFTFQDESFYYNVELLESYHNERKQRS